MHPIELMRKYQWSYLDLALNFAVSEGEARRWGFRKTATSYRNPPAMAFVLAKLIDEKLTNTAA